MLEESLDRALLDALRTRDPDALARLPRSWIQGSTGEVLCWVSAAGALEHLPMDVIDYIPAYRSAAGTGTGLGHDYTVFATQTGKVRFDHARSDKKRVRIEASDGTTTRSPKAAVAKA